MKAQLIKLFALVTIFGLVSTIQAAPATSKKTPPRPAAQSESPEDRPLQELPLPPRQTRSAHPTREQLLDECNKASNCRAKLKAASPENLARKPLPAARGESPEERAAREMPDPPQNPNSTMIWQELLGSLLAWLNPIPSAHAATYSSPTITTTTTTTKSGYSVSLTPQEPVGEYNSQLGLYGVNLYYGRWLIWGNGSCYYFCASNSENKPYAYFRTTVPSTGDYVISVQATGRGNLKLRHQSGGPVIQMWDGYKSSGNYTTVEYLAQGTHYFYFWADQGAYAYFDGITIAPR